MELDNWDEVRTAYQVARLGTVSGAAEVLGVHHATVIRHIDALEGRLGVKLFQRHARGYTPTDAGSDLMQVAQATSDQFNELAGRLHGAGAAMTGELVVTTVDSFTPLLMPTLAEFGAEHPELTIRYITDPRVFRLEYGEAHVAIRAGLKPSDPDNVVQPLAKTSLVMGATKSYIKRYGRIDSEADFAKHRFIGPFDENHRAPIYRWMSEHVPADRILLRVSDLRDGYEALCAGGGVGFAPLWRFQENEDLELLYGPLPEWSIDLWLVTHVDLHRTAKVQALTAALKQAAKAWP